MKTLLSPATRRSVQVRIRSIEASAKPLWGRMNAPEMVAHCAAQLLMSLGKIDCPPRKSALAKAPLKQLLIFLAPWPKGAPTAPQLIRAAKTETWSADRDGLALLVDRFAEEIEDSTATHPLFGKLSTRAWGRLAFRHLDHHLRQFRV